MRIALIASPFIPVPPKSYGGTELFIANLAKGLKSLGHDVVVYANGESTIGAEVRWLYADSEWPLKDEVFVQLKDLNHTSWALADAAADCDLMHVNNVPALLFTRFLNKPFAYTIHHDHHTPISDLYSYFPGVYYVCISDFQMRQEIAMPRMRTIHHGIDLDVYHPAAAREDYLVFLGRIAPMKGTHLAIEAAKKAGIPLKIAGEVQPVFWDYFETMVRPHIDGRFIEYVGEVNLEQKSELLGSARAMLFPAQWNEPFGLVMIEAMACGAPVVALPGGAVEELVHDGINGYVCHSVEELAERARTLNIDSHLVRGFAESNFSHHVMAYRYAELYAEMLDAADDTAARHDLVA